jgi:hypothetical protein
MLHDMLKYPPLKPTGSGWYDAPCQVQGIWLKNGYNESPVDYCIGASMTAQSGSFSH